MYEMAHTAFKTKQRSVLLHYSIFPALIFPYSSQEKKRHYSRDSKRMVMFNVTIPLIFQEN